MRWFRTLTVITLFATVLLIAMGSTVRNTDSGLGCPDWPLCYGKILPPLEFTAIVEWVHRFMASIISILVAAQAVGAFMQRRQDPTLWRLAVASGVTVLGQALLGGVTVLTKNAPWTVGVHLAAALTLLALVSMMAACAHLGPGRTRIATRERAAFERVARWAMISTGVVLLIGAHTVATNAGFGCTTWPSCKEGPIPFLSGERLQHIHWLHRFTVLGGAAIIGWLFLHVREMRDRGPMLRKAAHSLIGLYGVQILVGGLNILSGFEESVRVTHLVVASAIWVVMILMWYAGRFSPDPQIAASSTVTPSGTSRAHA